MVAKCLCQVYRLFNNGFYKMNIRLNTFFYRGHDHFRFSTFVETNKYTAEISSESFEKEKGVIFHFL